MRRLVQATLRTRICGQVLVPVAHAGRPFCAGRLLVAWKIAKEDESIARMMALQLKLTPRSANLAIRTFVLIPKSRFCSLSVDISRFSKISSSLNVGLNGFSNFLPGVPGTFMALFRGDFGVIGMFTDSTFESPLIYPNPTSAG